MNRMLSDVAIIVLALLIPCAAFAQAPPGPLPPKPGTQIQQQPPAIRVRVDLVTAPVTVRDAAGELVIDLDKNDFRVFDNNVEQRILDFDLGGDPLSVVVAIEASSRIEALLPAVRKTGIMVTQAVLGETGEAAVVVFDDDIKFVQPFTTNSDAIEKSIAGFRMGTSGSLLYDTMARGVSLLSERPAGRRRVLLVMSEAADTGSEAALGEVLRQAQLSNVTIYSVGLSTTAAQLRAQPQQRGPSPIAPEGTYPIPPRPGVPQTPTTEQQQRGNIDLLALAVWVVQTLARTAGDNSLEVATVATGGLHISTFKDSSIETALAKIGAELHAQYTLSYRPTGTDPTGYHEIKVQIARRRGLSARSRPGYFVTP